MRVNVDSKALGDPRFRRLGARLKIRWQEALGRCVAVWMAAYESRAAEMDSIDVDALAERDGFSAAMVAVGLAEFAGPSPDHPASDPGGSPGSSRVRLRGVAARIDFLLEQDHRRELAAEAKRKQREQRTAPKSSGRSQGTSTTSRSATRLIAPKSTVPGEMQRDPANSPDQDHDHSQTRPVPRGDAIDAEPHERQPVLDLGPDPDPKAELRRLASAVVEQLSYDPERARAIAAHERDRAELDVATAHLDEQESA